MKGEKNKTPLPDENERVKQLVEHFSSGNVSAFVEKLQDVLYQSFNRIFHIDRRSGIYPGVSSDIFTAIIKAYPEVNPQWLLIGKGRMFAEEGKKQGDAAQLSTNRLDHDTISDRDLIAMFLRVSDAQTLILNDIRSKMAQETTQAIISDSVRTVEANLTDVRKKVTTLVERQELAIEEIRDQFSQLRLQKTDPSKGLRKKLGRNDGNE
ncbi:MAG TPA: hypothetical protein VGN00_14005 [Puia sp.]|jgi:hypothetical protein